MKIIKRFIVSLVLLLPFTNTVSATTSDKDITAIKQLFEQYMTSYNHYLTHKELPPAQPLYAENILFMSNNGGPNAAKGEIFSKQITRFLDSLSANGVHQVKWHNVNIKKLSDTQAIASNEAIRFKADNSEYNRVGATYLLKKVSQGWRIASFAVHNAETALSLNSN